VYGCETVSLIQGRTYTGPEQISIPYLVGEGKFADICADSANALLRVSTNHDSVGIGIN